MDAIGQFCLRGDILDVFPINCNAPVRIEWFDNELDAMRSFDVNNQRSLKTLQEIKIMPLTVEGDAVYDASVFDYCAASTLVVLDEPVRTFEMLEKLDKENKADAAELFPKDELVAACAQNGVQLVSALGHSYLKELPALSIPDRKSVV